MFTEESIREELKQVKDPEIPSISIVDLGIVTGIAVDNDAVHVTLTPTFAGCPALKIMEELVIDQLNTLPGIAKVTVETNFETTWTTDLITPEGREAIKRHGLAPPKLNCSTISMEILADTNCPYCDSDNTTLKKSIWTNALPQFTLLS